MSGQKWAPFRGWTTMLVGFVVEGACDYCAGRPRDQNPYAPSLERQAWDYGWEEAAGLFPGARMLTEVSRWDGPPWLVWKRQHEESAAFAREVAHAG